MTRIFTGQGLSVPALVSSRTGKPYCRASVHRRDGWGFSQCTKAGKHQDADGVWWCEIHEPTREAARQKETDARQDAAYQKRRREHKYGYSGEKLRDALRLIANGHNDPRALAIEVLGDMLTEELP